MQSRELVNKLEMVLLFLKSSDMTHDQSVFYTILFADPVPILFVEAEGLYIEPVA